MKKRKLNCEITCRLPAELRGVVEQLADRDETSLGEATRNLIWEAARLRGLI
jgi:hypothetical protein